MSDACRPWLMLVAIGCYFFPEVQKPWLMVPSISQHQYHPNDAHMPWFMHAFLENATCYSLISLARYAQTTLNSRRPSLMLPISGQRHIVDAWMLITMSPNRCAHSMTYALKIWLMLPPFYWFCLTNACRSRTMSLSRWSHTNEPPHLSMVMTMSVVMLVKIEALASLFGAAFAFRLACPQGWALLPWSWNLILLLPPISNLIIFSWNTLRNNFWTITPT